MFCDKCGAKLGTGAKACPPCGKPLVSLMPPTRGIAGHVRLLGILWVAYGALHVLPGLVLTTFAGSHFLPPEVPEFVGNILSLIAGLFMVTGACGVLVGAGLLMRQSWARMASLVVAAISLINIPFGTALGIYTMWALLPAGHEEEYRALSRVA
jgi:hypothetical protein